MKLRYLTIAAFLLVAPIARTETNGADAGVLPNQGQIVAGKGADGKEHFFSVDNSGNLNVIASSTSPVGAAHEANSQVATSTTAATLIIARPTRTSCTVKNLDATITVYIGAATVTSGNGMPLKPGESIAVTAQTLWQVIAASGTPTVAVLDEYN